MDYPSFSLEGQVAIVTGASKGIGYGLAKALAHAGAKVAVCARDVENLERLVGEISAEGHVAKAYQLDVTNVPTLEPVFRQICGDFDGLHILVNNAGLGDTGPAVEVTEADWDKMFAVNAKGLFFAAQAAGRIMLERGYGRIVNMSSQASVVGIRDHAT